MNLAPQMFDSCQDIVEMDMKNIEHFASEVIKLADMPLRRTSLRVGWDMKHNSSRWLHGKEWANVDPGFCRSPRLFNSGGNYFSSTLSVFRGWPLIYPFIKQGLLIWGCSYSLIAACIARITFGPNLSLEGWNCIWQISWCSIWLCGP